MKCWLRIFCKCLNYASFAQSPPPKFYLLGIYFCYQQESLWNLFFPGFFHYIEMSAFIAISDVHLPKLSTYLGPYFFYFILQIYKLLYIISPLEYEKK